MSGRGLWLLGFCCAILLPGCAVGLMERDLALNRDLRAEDLAFIHDIKTDAAAKKSKDADIEIQLGGRHINNADGDRSRFLWVFPVFARRKTVVVSGPVAAGSTASEVPAIFPALSLYLGLRHESGASFDSADGTRLATVSFVELNPLARVAVSRDKRVVSGWEFVVGKGLLGVGSSAHGPYMQLLWFFRLSESGEKGQQNQIKTIIRVVEPDETDSDDATDATGAAADAIFM